ncbi:PREDICTED: calmodulin-like [Priapulus caudatus]|uniref:Calmodulin-like n=1 Tax=Priapulus caudatus TaxID=37621 RepID=A0ABM1F377_PRICU|nr:PREDICTED: calmodulin-like [Priapulus caudatus]
MRVADYRTVFNSWGGDSSRGLSVDDLERLLRRLLSGRSVPSVQNIRLIACDMIGALDTSGCTLSFQAFVDYMATKRFMRDIDFEYTEAFRLFDRDGNGKLDREELRLIIRKLNPDVTDMTIAEMVKSADADGDGNIDYEEFVKLASAKRF